MRFVFLLVLLFLPVSALLAQATASDTFTIKLVVGGDSEPPTTPTISAITPVSTTSISLSWSTSTDNFSLAGYQVFRDTFQIATTTLTSYTDTALTANTTYTYEIVAFDSFYNYSSTSASASTTTLPITVIATTTPEVEDDTDTSSLRSRKNIVVNEYELVTGTTTAELSWKTNNPTTFSLRWGRTSSYELGYVATALTSTAHSTLIPDLEPGTTYYFELVAFQNQLPSKVVASGKFQTSVTFDQQSPPNVQNLQASVDELDVLLSWDNPDTNDFAGVRVLRNHFFFPNDTIDGYLVYQGSDDSLVDTNSLLEHRTQFYTVYTYDSSGNTSSGAVIFVQLPATGTETGNIQPTFEFDNSTSPSIGDFDSIIIPVNPADKNDIGYTPDISPSDLEIWQESYKQTLADQQIELNESLPYTLLIPKTALPDHLKSIIVTITNPSDNNQTFSFLLRLNKSGTSYEAKISPSNVSGRSKMTINIYDFRNRTVTTLSNTLEYSGKIQTKGAGLQPIFPDFFVSFFTPAIKLASIGLLILLLILLLLFIKRRVSGEDNK